MRARGWIPLIALLAVVLAAPAAHAGKLTLTPFGGWTMFDKELLTPGGSEYKDSPYWGGRLGFGGGPWGFEVAGGYTKANAETAPGDVTFYHLSGNIVFNASPDKAISPFFSLGGGWSRFDRDAGDKENPGAAEGAAGLNFKLNETLALRLEARDQLWVSSKNIESSHINNWILGAGLSFGFGGKPKDADGDGVPDKKDKCANTTHGCKVDANGCPTDADQDGVCDGLDKCPNTPHGAKVDASGCPMDSDGDGVVDGIDQCPDTPKGATVDAKGCPSDADGDGVPDGIDQCANTTRGCTVDARGCPTDSDGDGVCDGLDKCPNTPQGARVDRDGCPIEIMEKETELLDTGMIRIENLNFETGKAVIAPESEPTLDVVGHVLCKWPELKIEIGGHTDSRGAAAANQKLSEARANAVKTYLSQKFDCIKADQFTVKGYGESKPLAPNTNALNMAKNRRVEFKVLNKETLKHEAERRKTLQNQAPADTTKH